MAHLYSSAAIAAASSSAWFYTPTREQADKFVDFLHSKGIFYHSKGKQTIAHEYACIGFSSSSSLVRVVRLRDNKTCLLTPDAARIHFGISLSMLKHASSTKHHNDGITINSTDYNYGYALL